MRTVPQVVENLKCYVLGLKNPGRNWHVACVPSSLCHSFRFAGCAVGWDGERLASSHCRHKILLFCIKLTEQRSLGRTWELPGNAPSPIPQANPAIVSSPTSCACHPPFPSPVSSLSPACAGPRFTMGHNPQLEPWQGELDWLSSSPVLRVTGKASSVPVPLWLHGLQAGLVHGRTKTPAARRFTATPGRNVGPLSCWKPQELSS